MPLLIDLFLMNTKHRTTSSTALYGRPERPFKYVCSVTLPDGSVGYDRPLENYFDTTMASRLLPSHPPSRLYDTVARAHDNRFQVSTDMLDPSIPIPRPLLLNQPERPRSLAKVSENSPDYMGISPDAPEWRPRRSSYEDRRGAVGVSPSKVNTLVPYIPPIDTSMPPPSEELLEAMAKQILADVQADIETSESNATTDTSQSSATEDDFTFDYDSDSSLEVRVTVPRAPTPQPEESDSETDPYCWDSDTDTDSDHEYSYKFTPEELCRGTAGLRWLIFPRRPSVEIATPALANPIEPLPAEARDVDKQDVAMDVTPPPSDERPTGKRRRGGNTKSQVTKTPKRDANDTPARRTSKHQSDPEPGCSCKHTPPTQASPLGCDTTTSPNPPVSSIAATAMELDHVRIESRNASPMVGLQPNTAPPLKPTRSFPCLLDHCTQICASTGDLYRHQQSLRHHAPSYPCLACGKSYTRSDALKRHLNTKTSCKKLHTPKAGDNADGDPIQTEANTEAP